MKFIEMSGATLRQVLKAEELREEDLSNSGVNDQSIVRVNEQGDIEVRRESTWDAIGGLIGDFENRIKSATGLTWA